MTLLKTKQQTNREPDLGGSRSSNLLSRRSLNKGLALGGFAALSGLAPGLSLAQTKGQEQKIKIGHVGDVSSSALWVARAQGLDKSVGLAFKPERFSSIDSLSDGLEQGRIEAAIMPLAVPLQALVTNPERAQTQPVTPFLMGANGGAVVVTRALYHAMVRADQEAMLAPRPTKATALLKLARERQQKKDRPLRFGIDFYGSEQHMILSYWLADAGLDLSRDVTFLAMSGPMLVASLKAQAVDGFIALDPWCSYAISASYGYGVITSQATWGQAPMAALYVRVGWADQNVSLLNQMIQTLDQASKWCDQLTSREALVQILADPGALNVPASIWAQSLQGEFQYFDQYAPEPAPEFITFNRYGANFPWLSDATWILSQYFRWGILSDIVDLNRLARRLFRPDIYRDALLDTQTPVPFSDFRTEGEAFRPYISQDASRPMVMGRDAFFDGRLFNPTRLSDYIDGFANKNSSFDAKLFREING